MTTINGVTTPTLYFKFNGKSVQGWQDISIQRSIEACPSMVQATMFEYFPGEKKVTITEGDKLVITDDKDVVFTGWVDTVSRGFGPQGNYVHISGRSLCQDIVDCTNLYTANMIAASNVVEYAKKLCDPFKITVKDETNGQAMPAIPNIPISLTDRVYDLIERIARFSGVLVYDNELGELVIAKIAADKMAGSLTQGQNVLSADYTASLAQRYSDYRFVWQASGYVFGPVTGGQVPTSGSATDPVLKALGRNRPFVGVSNQADLGGQPIAQQRATWEANRRLGRGYKVHCSVVGWRDSKLNLWRPNARVTVELPGLNIQKQEFVIAEVNNIRSENGSITELTMYPPQAFSTEPIAVLDPIATMIANPGITQQASPALPASSGDNRRDKG